MDTNRKILFITLLMIFSLTIFAVEKRWSLDIETGPVFASSNTIQVPNPGGTRFSLSDAFDIDSKIYYRIRLNFLLGETTPNLCAVCPFNPGSRLEHLTGN